MNEESLFAAALDKHSAAERRAFLDSACGDDRQLRARVEQLLCADDRSVGILENGLGPAARVTVDSLTLSQAEPPNFPIAEQVGEGGMGVVYRARDERLDRDVALKLLHTRFSPDGPAARRFLGEARVTARLQHPGVPPVHQVGVLPDGRPFLVMKLIEGRTLADLLAVDEVERGKLVATFEQICQAVAYAHAHKVVHRDLKTANIMVGAFGEVQVMDWGLAKVLAPMADAGATSAIAEPTAASGVDSEPGADDATRTGSVLGTPAYMPPEQANGAIDEIDERSDVFGLGAILCAILTGNPPYVGADFNTTRQLAAIGQLGDAFARLDRCGADPEMVELCKRCLAASKAERPADAGEVARSVADLRAAAEERARAAELDRVRAQGEKAKVEAETREQQKRRHVLLALAASVLLLLAGGFGFIWYSDRKATEHRVRLAQNGEAAAALLDQCEEALRNDRADQAAMALDAAERRSADGGSEGLASRMSQCRADLKLIRALNGIAISRWRWAGKRYQDPKAVAVQWRAALAAYGIDPDESRTTDAVARVGASLVRDRLLTALDDWFAAEPTAGLRAILHGADPDSYRDMIRDALGAKGTSAIGSLAMQPEALVQPPRFAAVLGRLRGVTPERQRAVLLAALRARPSDLGLLMAMGASYPIRPEWRGERQRWYQAAVAAHPESSAAHNNLGLTLASLGDLDGAIAEFCESIRLDPKNVGARTNLGLARSQQGDLGGAIAEFREAIRLDPHFSTAHSSLGAALRVKGDLAEAIAEHREAIRLDPMDANAHNNFGIALRDQGDWVGAVAEHREAVRLDPKDQDALNNLALVLADGPNRVRDGKLAVSHATRACVLTGWKNAQYIDTLAAAYAVIGEFDQAIAFQTKALSFSNYDKKYGAAARARLNLYQRKQPRFNLIRALDATEAEVRGDWPATGSCWDEIAAFNPMDVSAHVRAVQFWSLAGRPDQALSHVLWIACLEPALLTTSIWGHAFPSGPGSWLIDNNEVVQTTWLEGPWLRIGNPTWTDYNLELEAMRSEGGKDGFGVGFRMAGPADFYLANFGGWGNKLFLVQADQSGKPGDNLPGPKRLVVEDGRWYTVRIEARGELFRVYLDGRELLAFRDGRHARGGVGLRSWGSVNRFRNIKVTDPAGRILFDQVPRVHSPTAKLP